MEQAGLSGKIEIKKADGSDNAISYGMIGFRSGSATPGNNSYTDLEYAAYPYRHSTVRFYRSGTSQGDSGGAWSAGDKHRLVYGTDGYEDITLVHRHGKHIIMVMQLQYFILK